MIQLYGVKEDQFDLDATTGSFVPYSLYSDKSLPVFGYEKRYGKYFIKTRDIFTSDLSFSINKNVLGKVKKEVGSLENSNVKETALQLVSLLEGIILPNLEAQLPSFVPDIRDDGSFLFEWRFLHYRLGFSIEVDIKESCWYFVSDETLGYYSSSGYTDTPNLNSILEYFIPFIIAKSFD